MYHEQTLWLGQCVGTPATAGGAGRPCRRTHRGRRSHHGCRPTLHLPLAVTRPYAGRRRRQTPPGPRDALVPRTTTRTRTPAPPRRSGAWLAQPVVDHPAHRRPHPSALRRLAAPRSRRPVLAAAVGVVAPETRSPRAGAGRGR